MEGANRLTKSRTKDDQGKEEQEEEEEEKEEEEKDKKVINKPNTNLFVEPLTKH